MVLYLNLFFLTICFTLFSLCYAANNNSELNMLGNFTSFTSNDDGCHFLLESFARVSSNFTYCAVSNARPILLCQNCSQYYVLSVEVHKDILELMDKGGESCEQKLLNLDRLQVVEGGFGFISSLWKRANCDACFESLGPDEHHIILKNEIQEILRLQNEVDSCITEHRNDTEVDGKIVNDPKVCFECKPQYLELNSYYNNLEVANPICMDIIDMINTTRQGWSVDLGCCLDRKNPEYSFLVISTVIAILPVIFYLLACTFTGNKEHQVLLLKNRCSIPYPGFVPPTPGTSEIDHDPLPSVSSSSSTADVNAGDSN